MQSPWLWFLIECSANLFEGLILISFFNTFLRRRFEKKVIYWILPIIHATVTYIINQTSLETIPSVLLLATIGIAIALIFYVGTIPQRVLLTIAFFVVWLVSEFALLALLNLVFIDFFVHLMQPSIDRLTSIMVCKLGLFIILKIVQQFVPSSENRLPLRRILPLFSLPVVSVMIVFDMQIFWQEQTNSSLFALTAISTLALLFTNLIVFDQYYQMQKDAEISRQYQLLQQHLKSEKQQIHLLDEQQQEVRRLAHDVKNSLLPVVNALNQENQAMAKSLLVQILDGFAQSPSRIETGYSLIDAILSQKQKVSQDRQIRLNVEYHLNDIQRISDIDLSVILGNALDNAIEATEQMVEMERRVINLTLQSEKGLLTIKLINPISGQLIKKNEQYLSTKSDHNNHGFGISSIRLLVEKYQGMMQIDTMENEFSLTIILHDSKV
jgi:two-component system, LytTR family, sensor histidine kinase AgrC